MTAATKSRYVDVSNPDMAVECPRCGLVTARFVDMCRNCGYKLWPSSYMASAAFKAWQATDPEHRREVSRFDLAVPVAVDSTVDFEARARELGIHLFPSSNWPFVICFGVGLLAFAAIPFPAAARLTLLVVGVLVFLCGVAGWVLVEDVHMFPADAPTHGDGHH